MGAQVGSALEFLAGRRLVAGNIRFLITILIEAKGFVLEFKFPSGFTYLRWVYVLHVTS